jgi:hypothetical protein
MTEAALRYNGGSKDWSQSGSPAVIDTIHWVDQGMALSVLVPQGSIQSSPSSGSTLHEIHYLGTPNLKAEVQARIEQSNPAARFIAAGQARIERIDVETQSGKLAVAVYYQNLVTKQRDRVNFSGT